MRTLTKATRHVFALCAIFAAAGCVTTTSVAYPERPDQASPPWIAGRISYASGDTQIAQPGESEDTRQWRSAVVNDVVTVGTNVYTAAEATAEIRVGGHAFRLAENGRIVVRSLDGDRSSLQLDDGTLNVRWRDYEQRSRVDILTPSGRVELLGAGRYRIDTNGAQSTVTVFQGHAQLVGPNGVVAVEASKSLTLSGSNFSFARAVSTPFDEWALSRDERVARAPRYVSPEMTGADELDAYGQWVPDPNYGTVWVPAAVPVGWAPYRYGHWGWVAPWGWTWIDDAPWGFAPFHYGRWVVIESRWAWYPGAYVVHPVYAPALVGFAGGSGVSVSISIGSPPAVWYPLAPWQAYQPWYPHSVTYVTTINRTVIINNPPPNVAPMLQQQIGTTTSADIRQIPRPAGRDQAMAVRPTTPMPGAPSATLLNNPPGFTPGARQNNPPQTPALPPAARQVAPALTMRPAPAPSPVVPAPPAAQHSPTPPPGAMMQRPRPPMAEPIERGLREERAPREGQRFVAPVRPMPVAQPHPLPQAQPPHAMGPGVREERPSGERGRIPPAFVREKLGRPD